MESSRWPGYFAGFAKAQYHLMSVDISIYMLETSDSLTHLFDDLLIPLLLRPSLLGKPTFWLLVGIPELIMRLIPSFSRALLVSHRVSSL
jgi:hypothetical protein